MQKTLFTCLDILSQAQCIKACISAETQASDTNTEAHTLTLSLLLDIFEVKKMKLLAVRKKRSTFVFTSAHSELSSAVPVSVVKRMAFDCESSVKISWLIHKTQPVKLLWPLEQLCSSEIFPKSSLYLLLSNPAALLCRSRGLNVSCWTAAEPKPY